MKTFKQFSEQAYESYELIEGPIDYLRSKIKSKVQSVKDYPSTLRSAASAIKKDPIGSLKAGSKGLTKVVAKDVITSPIATRIKRATGNNPIANLAIDTAADVASVITISVQPADIGDGATTLEVPAPSDQTFSVTAAAATGNLVYQGQRKTASSNRWVNITATLDSSAYTGHDGATLTVVAGALTGLTLNGYQYRVKLTSSAGAEEVISDVATLNLVDEV